MTSIFAILADGFFITVGLAVLGVGLAIISVLTVAGIYTAVAYVGNRLSAIPLRTSGESIVWRENREFSIDWFEDIFFFGGLFWIGMAILVVSLTVGYLYHAGGA